MAEEVLQSVTILAETHELTEKRFWNILAAKSKVYEHQVEILGYIYRKTKGFNPDSSAIEVEIHIKAFNLFKNLTDS